MLGLLFFVLSVGTVQPGRISGVLGQNTGIDSLGLLTKTNQQREATGSKALTINQELSRAAQAKAEDMKTRDYWSHQTPDGEQPWIFIDETTYAYQRAGENLAYGFTSNDGTVTGWMNSESHRENMLDGDYSEVGFGITRADNFQNKGQETIVVAFYASPQPLTGSPTEVRTYLPQTLGSNDAVSLFGSMTTLQTTISTFAIGLTTGLLAMFMIGRHSLKLKRAIATGEHFVMHHPVLDIGLTSLIAVGALLLQSVGFIG